MDERTASVSTQDSIRQWLNTGWTKANLESHRPCEEWLSHYRTALGTEHDLVLVGDRPVPRSEWPVRIPLFHLGANRHALGMCWSPVRPHGDLGDRHAFVLAPAGSARAVLGIHGERFVLNPYLIPRHFVERLRAA